MDPREPIVNAYTNLDYTACLSLIEASSSEISSQTDMRILQASCLININGRTGEAHQILDKILEEDPENGLAFYGKGLAFLKEENLEKSIENFTKSADLDKTGVISKAQIMKLKAEELLKSKRSLKRLSGKQSKEKAAPITCEICNRSFAQLFSLNRHKLIHSGERPHKCSLCNFGFVQKSDLQRHMSVHNENSDFPCQTCEKKFKSKKNLSLHLMTHNTERPFKCETCGKDFKYRRLMKLHQIIHSKRKKYNCDFCEKIFVTKPSLKAHVMMHINRMNKEGVRLDGNGGIVENFEASTGDSGMEIMNIKNERQNVDSSLNETLNFTDSTKITLKSEDSVYENLESSSLTFNYPVAPEMSTNQPETVSIASKTDCKLTKTKNKNQVQNQEKVDASNQIVKKPRGRPPKKSLSSQNQATIPQNQNLDLNPQHVEQNSSSVPSTSNQKSPQAVRNSVRIQSRHSLGSKRSLIKTNPKSSRIRRESFGYDKNTENIQQKLEKVKQNLSQIQKEQQIRTSPNPDQMFSTSSSSLSEFPQISITNNKSPAKFSIDNIELPPSLQIRPVLGVQGSKIRGTRNSISDSQLNLIPPTKFINSTSTIPALDDPRISAIFSNPHISVAITSTSSFTTVAKPEMKASPSTIDSNWADSTVSPVSSSQEQQISIQNIKLEPVEVPNNEEMEEASTSHDSLFSSDTEHPTEWNLFFKSLMHDLTKMDDRQKRKFKQKTFMLIDDILQ